MLLLLASLAPLLAGPLLVKGLQSSPPLARALDSFVLISLAGLIFVHILPHSVEAGGLTALVAAVFGLALPFLGERFVFHRREFSLTPVLVLGLAALALHGVLDGVALVSPHEDADGGNALALAVIMHRLPAGLVVWWLVKPRMGARAAGIVIGVLVAATITGFILAGLDKGHLFHGETWYILQALLSGSLIHVILHQSTGPATPRHGVRWQVASLMGGLAGVGLLVLLDYLGVHGEEEHGHGLGHTFLSLALASSPPLLLAYLLSAVLRIFDTRGLNRWLGRGSTLSQSLRGTIAGLPLNICSCAVTSLYQGLVTRGVPATAALAFMVAAPEIGIGAVLLSLELLGVQVGLMRMAFAAILGLVIGIALGGLAARSRTYSIEIESLEDRSKAEPLARRVRSGINFGFGVVVDRTLPWLLVGMGLAAFLQPILDPATLAAVPGFLQVPMMALFGAPLYVCATGSTPLIAMLIHQGITPGAGIAFLLTGPATNVTTMGILSRLHGRKVSLLFSLGILVAAIVFGYIIDATLPEGYTATLPGLDHLEGGVLANLSLIAVTILLVTSVARLGVPGFLAEVLPLHKCGPDICISPCVCGCGQVQAPEPTCACGLDSCSSEPPKDTCCEDPDPGHHDHHGHHH